MGLKSLWRKTKNVAGDGLAYGGVPFTGGLSLLGKKGVRDAAGGLWNDVTGKTAARDAANAQVAAADRATSLQREMFDKNLELNKPWYETGVSALSDLAGGMKSGAFDAPTEEFDAPREYQDPGFKFDFQADPGYQFRQGEQQKAVERSAAAGGGLFAGATLSDLAKRSGEMASEEYGNAFGRARGVYENDRATGMDASRDSRNFAYGNFSDRQTRKRDDLNNRFARLSSLAGLGDAATGRSGQAAGLFGQQAGDNAIGAGNAKAGGRVGGYNAQRDFISGLANFGMKGASMYASGGAA